MSASDKFVSKKNVLMKILLVMKGTTLTVKVTEFN